MLNDDIEAETCGLLHSLQKDELTNCKGGNFETGSMFIDNSPTAGQKKAVTWCVLCGGAIGITIGAAMLADGDDGGDMDDTTVGKKGFMAGAKSADNEICTQYIELYNQYGF